MKRMIAIAGAAGLFAVALATGSCVLSADSSTRTAEASAQVVSGTRLLIALREPLSTKNAKAGDRFSARTLEPIPITGGSVLRPARRCAGMWIRLKQHIARAGLACGLRLMTSRYQADALHW